MKSNNVTINVNLGEGCENTTVSQTQPETLVEITNNEDVIESLVSKYSDSDEKEQILSEANLGSIRVNPFLARRISLPEEMTQVIGDCIHLPSIFGGQLGHRVFHELSIGESSPIGVLVSEKGVFAAELSRLSGKAGAFNEGDDLDLVLRSSAGKTVAAWEMQVEASDDDGGVIMAAKKCDCKVKVKFNVTFKPLGFGIEVTIN